MRDESEQQTTPIQMNQCNDPRRANGAVEEHTEGGVKRKGEAAGFSRRDTRQRETLGTLLGQTPEKQKPFTFTFTYYSEEKDDPATHLKTKRPRQDSPTRTTDFQSEVEFWKFMKSIMPSNHQEMIHLQEGVLCQNDHTNNTGRFTLAQQENRPMRSAPPGS